MKGFAALFAMLIATVPASGARAEKRIALVMGNASYTHAARLANPVNDASDVAAFLKTLSFDVVMGSDLTQDGMRRTLRDFRARAEQSSVALFFYAGHGMQVGGINVLVPVDARLEDELDIEPQTLRLDAVMAEMERAAPINIVLLDACRNNPLAERLMRSMGSRSRSIGLSRGLAPVSPRTVDTLIMFATEPGDVADDGSGRNSPFTSAILRHLGKADEVSLLLKDVVADVRAATKGKQRPQQLAAMERKLYLSGLPGSSGAGGDEAAKLREELDRLRADFKRAEDERRRTDADRIRPASEERSTADGKGQVATPAPPSPTPTVQSKLRPMRDAIKLRGQSIFPDGMAVFPSQMKRASSIGRSLSGGKLNLDLHAAGSIVPPFEVLTAVGSGVLDAGWWPSAYGASKNSAFNISGGNVAFGLRPAQLVAWIEGDGSRFYSQLYGPLNVKALPCAVTGTEGSWFRREIKAPGDLRGLKVRWLGLGGTVMHKLGAVTVLLPGGELVPGMHRGVIDGLEFSVPKVDVALGLQQVAKFYYFPSWHQPATLVDLIVSNKVWGDLGPEGHAVLAETCRQNLHESLSTTDRDEREGLAELRAKGVTVREFPQVVIEAARRAADEVHAAEGARNPLFKTMLESFLRQR